MTRRRMLVFGLLAGLLVLGLTGWIFWLAVPRTAITQENAAKIQKGVTLAEVEAILGGPARDEATGPVERIIRDPNDRHPRIDKGQPVMLQIWNSDHLSIQVFFDSDDRVTRRHVVPVRRVQENYLDMLRRWLCL